MDLFSRLSGPRGPLRYLFPGWGVPDELEPKLDPARTRVFEDEVDPAWRDPATGGPGADTGSEDEGE